jgi:hypothetical protein
MPCDRKKIAGKTVLKAVKSTPAILVFLSMRKSYIYENI